MASRIALATCSELPDLDADERLVVPALAQRGIEARSEVWDDPAVRWDEYQLVVVRTTWDYPDRRDAFVQWATHLRGVCNSAAVLEWNTDKTYLRDLGAAGIPVVPTVWVQPRDGVDAALLPEGDAVVKPAVSGGSRNTERYSDVRTDAALRHINRLLEAGRTVMVQPYVASVDDLGETGLIYFDGEYSHAVRKAAILTQPGVAEGRLFAPERITDARPSATQRTAADAVLDALPWPRSELLYARVDLVWGEGESPLLLELETTEPSLFLGLGGAAGRFASAIARRLGTQALD